jgi:hypothetical protein
MKLISASIDLNKIDESKVVTGKNGERYFNIDITVKDEKNQFGQDTAITIQQSKAERDSKAKKVYIGNGKTIWEGAPLHQPTKQSEPVETQMKEPETDTNEDDLPF